MNDHSEMISFGAGVNSVAMTIMLVEDGWRGPIVFADPGAEHPDTYCYLQMFERDWLKPRGLEVTTISPMTYPELYLPSYRMSFIEKCDAKQIVPGVAFRWCTTEYKRRPLTRWSKQNNIMVQLLGIAADEAHRVWRGQQDGTSIEYPLVDEGVGRWQCKIIIEEAGLAIPPKSGCWFCPFQRQSEWRALYNLRPDLFQKAIEMDEAARQRKGIQIGAILDVPLINMQRMWDAQLELPLMPEPEYEYQMCECRL